MMFDLETTGLNTKTDRIVQIAALKLTRDFFEIDRLVLKLNPTVPIPSGASAVHGIKDEDVKGCPTFSQKAEEIHAFFKDCDLSGYNILGYDIPLLTSEFERVNMTFDVTAPEVYDALQVFRRYEPMVPSKKLVDAYQYYCNEVLEGAHDALADTLASAAVLEVQVQKYANHPQYPLSCVGDIHKWFCTRSDYYGGQFAWNDKGELTINFGKHAGKTLQTMVSHNKSYVSWMLRQNFDAPVKNMLRKALDGEFPVNTAEKAEPEPERQPSRLPRISWDDDDELDNELTKDELKVVVCATPTTEEGLISELKEWMAKGAELVERVNELLQEKGTETRTT